MGGEGSMMNAINSLKNNRSLLAKRKDKQALSGSYSHVELREFPKATPKKLINIRKKMQCENKRIWLKQLVVFVVLILVFVCGIALSIMMG
jgi:hypothetical protein